MHSLVRRYIKTAIAFLFLGLAIGGWTIVRRELWRQFPNPYQISAHTHAVFAGFILMMILGVALWLFPRPEKSDPRYRPARIEAAYWLLTAGTASRVGGELLRPWNEAEWLRWLVVVSSFLQIAGLGLYFWTMWYRIRSVGSQLREERGERF